MLTLESPTYALAHDVGVVAHQKSKGKPTSHPPSPGQSTAECDALDTLMTCNWPASVSGEARTLDISDVTPLESHRHLGGERVWHFQTDCEMGGWTNCIYILKSRDTLAILLSRPDIICPSSLSSSDFVTSHPSLFPLPSSGPHTLFSLHEVFF